MSRLALLIPLALVAADSRPLVAQTTKLQVSVLLDLSRSTRGYVELARRRIETEVVAQLNEARVDAEVAIWTFGNGPTKKVLDFTTKPDEFKEALAEYCSDEGLAGGSEPCGLALEQVRDDLKWSRVTNDDRFILIVGNEDFDQTVRINRNGKQSTRGTVVARGLPTHKVKDRNGDDIPLPIVLNTLHLGPAKEAERHSWDTAAKLARGRFENIDGR